MRVAAGGGLCNKRRSLSLQRRSGGRIGPRLQSSRDSRSGRHHRDRRRCGEWRECVRRDGRSERRRRLKLSGSGGGLLPNAIGEGDGRLSGSFRAMQSDAVLMPSHNAVRSDRCRPLRVGASGARRGGAGRTARTMRRCGRREQLSRIRRRLQMTSGTRVTARRRSGERRRRC